MTYELNNFYNEDCLQAMKTIPDKYFDLAIVDPPYGIGESGHKNAARGKLAVAKTYKPFYGEDKEPPTQEYFKELFRVSQNQIIFGANHFISRVPKDSHCWVVWDKQNGNTDYADCELAWTSFSTAVRQFTFRWQGMLQGDMKNKEQRIHPTQKPIALYLWILKNYANKGDKILDTHVGSASSLIACERMGFNYIGFEIDKNYYDKATERINKERQQFAFDLSQLVQVEQFNILEGN